MVSLLTIIITIFHSISIEVYNMWDARYGIGRNEDRIAIRRTLGGRLGAVLVGDRSMITQTRIDEDIAPAGLDWIAALRAPVIRALVEAGELQLSLFDRRDMAAITSPDYPGERPGRQVSAPFPCKLRRPRRQARHRWSISICAPEQKAPAHFDVRPRRPRGCE
jgi:hypothetical protein